MRKIIFISLLATFFITACKKEAVETKTPAISDLKNIAPNAPVPCTGNNWLYAGQNPVYSSQHDEVGLVYNNKLYRFSCWNQLVKIFDGTNWASVSSNVPYANPAASVFFSFGFTIGDKGYFNQTSHFPGYPSQNTGFYEYDFINNTWQQKADFPGDATHGQASFTISNKGYVAGGYNHNAANSISTKKQTWEYNQQNDTWEQKEDIPNFFGRSDATGFSIGNKGYIVNGRYHYLNNGTPATAYLKSLLQYDPVTDDWNYKTAFPGQARFFTNVFVSSGAAYAGGGMAPPTSFNDYYKYNPGTNAWTSIADPPVIRNHHASPNSSIRALGTFAINGKGYLVYIPNTNPYTTEGVLYQYVPQSCNTTSPAQ